MEIKRNTPNGKYNNILIDIDKNIYIDEYFTNDILKPTDIVVYDADRYKVIGCKVTQEEIFEVEITKVSFKYKIISSDVHYSICYPTKELAFQSMLADALKVIEEKLFEEKSSNDMLESYKIEKSDNSVEVKIGNSPYIKYELL